MLIYKYRGGNKKAFNRAIEGLRNNYFWASSIDQLNDPCEGITNKNVFKKQYRNISRFLGFKEDRHMQLLDENADEVLSFGEKMGIFSSSKTYLNELLWAHYANGHKGFCIEYDLEYLVKTDGGNGVFSLGVIYSRKPPKIDLLDIIKTGQNGVIHKNGFYKSNSWKYEQEHRLITNIIGENYYDPRAIKSIYFGLLISDKHKNAIREALSGKSVRFYQIVLQKDSYKFNKSELRELELKSMSISTFITTDGERFKYEVVRPNYHSHSGIGEFDIIIFDKMNEKQIIGLSKEIKRDRFKTANVLFFNYFLEGRKIEYSPSATCTFKEGKFIADCSNF